MKDGFIKVAAVSTKITVANPKKNVENICSVFNLAYKGGANIIVFPELCITGYTCNDLFFQEELLQQARLGLQEIVSFSKGKDALVFVGLPLEENNKIYSVAAAIKNGKILAFIPKSYLPNYNEFYEMRYFAPGEKELSYVLFKNMKIPFGTNILFESESIPGLKIACEICEDVWAPLTPSTFHAMAGANVIVNLSASNALVTKDTYRKNLIAYTSARLMAGYIYASAGEGESTQDLVFSGHNLIAENGTILAEAKRFKNEMIFADLDIQRLRAERRKSNTYIHESSDSYMLIPILFEKKETELTRYFDATPFVPRDKELRKKRCEDILAIQAMGLKKRYTHTNCKKAIIGVSGGLDSTLALLVTVRAFDALQIDRKGIISITMPCFGTTDRTYDNSCNLAKELGTTLIEIDIKEAVKIHFNDIGHDVLVQDVTYENTQARERTQILMDMANQEGGMVIGTSDMSELALGWATYNGDHMSMYAVNVGVPKTLVRHLVQYYAEDCGNKNLEKVLLDVLDTPVSPELLPPEDGIISQKTEDLVGPYELHDFFLYYYMRFGFTPTKIFRIAKLAFSGVYTDDFIKQWLKVFYQRFFAQQFKRSCLPDGPKVGSVALSPRGDLRMPSDASAQIWLDNLEDLQ